MFSLTRNGYSITPFIRMHTSSQVIGNNILFHINVYGYTLLFIFIFFSFIFFLLSCVWTIVRFYMFGNGLGHNKYLRLYSTRIIIIKQKKNHQGLIKHLILVTQYNISSNITDYSKFIYFARFPHKHTRNNIFFKQTECNRNDILRFGF